MDAHRKDDSSLEAFEKSKYLDLFSVLYEVESPVTDEIATNLGNRGKVTETGSQGIT